MKLLCETSVQYRNTGTTPAGSGPAKSARPQKSTLALGVHPPNNADNAELFLMLFTAANKTGTRYKVRDNLERVFTKFVAQGKATLSLRQPAHDVQIRCDAVQLRCFLSALKLGLAGKHGADPAAAAAEQKGPAVRLASLATTAIPASAQPVTKLVVRSRGDYPLRGLPKTLRVLQVNGIQRARFDSQICFLKHLHTLNLNDNAISELPRQLGQLRLQVLDMGGNRLGEGVAKSESQAWQWLDGEPLQETLQTLTLSKNGLLRFPFGVVRMRRLQTLNLEGNAMERLPFAVRRLRSLKFLNVANNKLTSLPSTIACTNYNTVDLSGNPFIDTPAAAPQVAGQQQLPAAAAAAANPVHDVAVSVPCLWECAGRVVAAKRLPYSARTLPMCLIELLEESPLCACGVLCFSAAVQPRAQHLNLRTEHVIYGNNGGDNGGTVSTAAAIRCDAVFCSRRCVAKYARRR